MTLKMVITQDTDSTSQNTVRTSREGHLFGCLQEAPAPVIHYIVDTLHICGPLSQSSVAVIGEIPNTAKKLVNGSLKGMEFRASHPPKCSTIK